MARGSFGIATAAAFAGALGACQTVNLGDPPADVSACRPSQTYFAQQIWPNVLDKDYNGKRCTDPQCHGSASSNSLRLTTPVPPALDAMGNVIIPIPFTAEWAGNYRAVTEQMNCRSVAASALLTRPSGIQTHGGGTLFSPTGTEADIIKGWVGAAPP